jgi:hypothetical protein
MRRLLIVSPHFPPVNTPDMHRVRMSLPYFTEFGWEPLVLAVDPAKTDHLLDSRLMETIPPQVPIHHTKAFAASWTRKLGFSALGLRAWPFLYRTGTRLIRAQRPDLIYFSTTVFPVLAIGRFWKRKFGVPFVVDMQDPWVGGYYEKRPPAARPPKYGLAQRMHSILEPYTMRAVDGIVAVSAAYHETLRRRYPWIREELCRTIPFGVSEKDFEVARNLDWHNPFFTNGDGLIHGVAAGALGPTKVETCRAICVAFREGLAQQPELFSRVRLHFVGTDYAPAAQANATIRPLAARYGIEDFILESSDRIPYLETLRLFSDSDFLLVVGSDDPDYTASKLYPYIMGKKPLIAIFREESSVAEILGNTRAGTIVSFGPTDRAAEIATKLQPALTKFLAALPFVPSTDWAAFEPYLAREMTRRQCELFDFVLGRTHK